MTTIQWVAAVWALAGFGFWCDCLRYNGPPDRWTSQDSRYTSWAQLLFFYLPLCIVAGPLLGIAMLAINWSLITRKRRRRTSR